MKKALTLNAVFSALSGIILILIPERIAHFFELPLATPFWVTGVVLIFFSLTILYEIKRANPIAILWIITQDMLWVTASIYWLVFNPFGTPQNANLLIAAVGLMVLLMAINQSAALAKTDAIDGVGTKQLKSARSVSATKSESWKVISDVGNYHQVAPNIDEVKIISGEGKGMVRSCSHGKDSWTESCSLWKEEEIYSFTVNTSAPDYPYPLKYLKGTWQVQEESPEKTAILLTFEFTYRYKIMSILVHPFLRWKFNKITEELLDNWQQALENKGEETAEANSRLATQDLMKR